MTKQDLIAKLNRPDLPGVGVIATTAAGNKVYYFYEDFQDSKGIDRAAAHFQQNISRGSFRRAEYIYKDYPGTLFFFDWSSLPGTASVNDLYVAYNRKHGYDYYYHYKMVSQIDGKEYTYESSPCVDNIIMVYSIPV